MKLKKRRGSQLRGSDHRPTRGGTLPLTATKGQWKGWGTQPTGAGFSPSVDIPLWTCPSPFSIHLHSWPPPWPVAMRSTAHLHPRKTHSCWFWACCWSFYQGIQFLCYRKEQIHFPVFLLQISITPCLPGTPPNTKLDEKQTPNQNNNKS